MTTNKLKTSEPGFWPTWAAKLMFTLISVKVWGLVAGTAISTWLLMINLHHQPLVVNGDAYQYGINGAQWITFNTTIWALIFGMKEIFRISESRDQTESETIKRQTDSKIAVARIRNEPDEAPAVSGKPGNGEFEVVAEEPPKQP